LTKSVTFLTFLVKKVPKSSVKMAILGLFWPKRGHERRAFWTFGQKHPYTVIIFFVFFHFFWSR
jgi:hypothetical protein